MTRARGTQQGASVPAQHASIALVGDEQALVARIRAGDVEAFEGVFHTYSGPLYAFVRAYVDSVAIAEEVVQDVFLRVWQRRAALSIDGSIATYLYAAARNVALNVVRRHRLEGRWHVSDPEEGPPREVPDRRPGPNVEVEARARDAAIAAAVAELSPRCRQAFMLRWGRRMSHAEVAAAMGTSIKTVEKQLGTAFKALRLALRAWVPGEP